MYWHFDYLGDWLANSTAVIMLDMHSNRTRRIAGCITKALVLKTLFLESFNINLFLTRQMKRGYLSNYSEIIKDSSSKFDGIAETPY